MVESVGGAVTGAEQIPELRSHGIILEREVSP
jgi:hypothetical protein